MGFGPDDILWLMVESFSKQNVSMLSGGDIIHKIAEQGLFKLPFGKYWKIAEVVGRPNGFLVCSNELGPFRMPFSTHHLLEIKL